MAGSSVSGGSFATALLSRSTAEVVAELKAAPTASFRAFVAAAAAAVEDAVLALLPAEDGDVCAAAGDGTLAQRVALVSAVAPVLQAVIALPTAVPSQLMPSVAALHQVLPFLPETTPGAAAREAVLRMCEAVLTGNVEGKEAVVPFTVAVRLDEVLQPGAKDAAFKRLWALREYFTLFDFGDESTRPVRDNVLRAYASPLFVKSADNAKMLTFWLSRVPELTVAIHDAVRMQWPAAARLVDVHADVYFKAWQAATAAAEATVTVEGAPGKGGKAGKAKEVPAPGAAEGAAVKAALETTCLQSIADMALHGSHGDMVKTCRRFLQFWCDKKKTKGVDSVLVRVLQPLLFRALACAHATVRRQAAALMFDAFPLWDTAGTPKDRDALLRAQLDAVGALLVDADAEVRVLAVDGASRILSLCWDVVPAPTRRAWLETWTTQLAVDAASHEVRLAVLGAVKQLVEGNAAAHGMLVPYLPPLGHLLHDRHDRVRASMAELLRAISPFVNTLSVAAVAPMEQLLARVCLDAAQPSIVIPLIPLVMPAICPAGAGDKKAIATALVRALSECEQAALVVLSYARAVIPTHQLVKVLLLLQLTLASAVANRDSRLAAEAAAGPGAPPQPRKLLDAGNHRLMGALARAVAVVWADVAAVVFAGGGGGGADDDDDGAGEDAAAMADAQSRLASAFGGTWIPAMLAALTADAPPAAAGVISSALMEVAQHLTAARVGDLATHLRRQLTAVVACDDPTLLPMLRCLCSWELAGEVLADATAALTAAAPTAGTSMAPRVAVAAIEYVLLHAEEGDFAAPDTECVAAAVGALIATMRAPVALLQRGSAAAGGLAAASEVAIDAARVWAQVAALQLRSAGSEGATDGVGAHVLAPVCKWLSEQLVPAFAALPARSPPAVLAGGRAIANAVLCVAGDAVAAGQASAAPMQGLTAVLACPSLLRDAGCATAAHRLVLLMASAGAASAAAAGAAVAGVDVASLARALVATAAAALSASGEGEGEEGEADDGLLARLCGPAGALPGMTAALAAAGDGEGDENDLAARMAALLASGDATTAGGKSRGAGRRGNADATAGAAAGEV